MTATHPSPVGIAAVKPDPVAESRVAVARQEPEEITGPAEPGEPALAGTVLNPGITSIPLWNDGVRVGGSAISTRMARYRISAKKKGLVWGLTTIFEEITARECNYCGSPPGNVQKHAGKLFRYSGIDRVDNSQGYTPDNCVACCMPCNFAKGKLGAADFLEWVDRMVNHQRAKAPKHPCTAVESGGPEGASSTNGTSTTYKTRCAALETLLAGRDERIEELTAENARLQEPLGRRR